MKRVISVVLILAMIFSFTATSFAAEGTGENSHADADVSLGTQDLSGELFSEVFGDGSDYQIIALELEENDTVAKVSYLAANDCILNLKVIEENSQETVFSKDVEAPAGEKAITVPLDGWSFPEHFWIEAVLLVGGNEVSQVFTSLDHTQAYQDFLATPSNDADFSENVILDFGPGDDGEDNFAVISQDVKVVYVESMDKVEEIGGSDSAALFGLMEETDGYVLSDVVNDEILTDLGSGDKILIFPMDNVSDARVLRIDALEEVVTLMADGEEGTGVEVTASSEPADLGEYFDYIRVSATAEADAGDIDTSTADPDVTFSDDIVVDPAAAEQNEEADLFGSGSVSGSISKTNSLTASISSGPVTVKDTVSITAKVSVSINYSTTLKIPTKLTSVTASSQVTAKNVFNIHSSRSFTWKPDPKKIGTIPVGTVAGVTFSIPVYLTFSATFNAVFDFTATQTCTYTITTTYRNGSYSQTTSKSASSEKSIKTEAKVVVMIGVKATMEASFLKVITIGVTGEVGIQATGTLQSVNSTSSYRHTSVLACLTVDLDLYVIPSFSLKLASKTLVSKTWSKTTVRLLTFYAHLGSNGNWEYGTGNCPHREYLTTINVKDGSNKNKALSGVAVKEGGKTLGTTNTKGQAKIWLSMKGHILNLTKSRYKSERLNFVVAGATSKTVTMYRDTGANEEIWTMTDLFNMTDSAWEAFIAKTTTVGNTIFQIRSVDELQLLSSFARMGTRTTEGLRFALDSLENTWQMGGAAWTPIGSAEMPFRGELDGNGITLTDLAVYGGVSNAGLFGCIDGALIHDLTLEDVSIAGGDYSGALAGMATGGSRVYDIAVDDGQVSGGNHVGGVIGGMQEAILLNSYNTAAVSGSGMVGGLAGSLGYSETTGLITNCYNAGALEGGTVGGVCGAVAAIPTAGLTEDDESTITDETGIQYAYYLDSTATSAVGSGEAQAAFKVTTEQANATNTEATIGEGGYASELSLLEALNNWYETNGVFSSSESGAQTGGENEQLSGETTPNSNPNDYYNRWYADRFKEDGSGGFPIFAEKAPTYLLTVEYVFEDGTQARATVKQYKTAGQAYDVDTPPIEGYHTYELEYKGVMPAQNLEYRVIYIKDEPYETMKGLSQSGKDAASGETFSIRTEEELILFADYVNEGKNTEGVTFTLLDVITLENGGFASVGTAEHPFKGVFDGGDLAIGTLSTPLFGYIENAEVRAVGVELSMADIDETSVGAIAANALNSAIRNCVVEANISGSAVDVGGVVGNAGGTLIDRCTISGTIGVQGTGGAGGVIGRMSGGTLRNCSSDADVTGSAQVGGLVGSALDQASVLNSCTTGDVGSAQAMTGGVVGKVTEATVANIYHSGSSAGDALIGSQENLTAESLWYREGGTTGVDTESASSYTYDETGFNSMLNAMNEWVMRQGTDVYMTWSAQITVTEGGEGEDPVQTVEAPPVFGDAYTFWLLNFEMKDGAVAHRYNQEYYPDATVWIAAYSEDGQLLKVFTVTESGEASETIPAEAAYAKAVVLDESSIPLDAAITATK